MATNKTYDFKEIPFEDLKLDDQNPRIPKSIRDNKPTEEQLIEYMLLDASLIELMLAIGENGYFPGEQLLVVNDNDGKYRVIEGNRRLTAVKLLNNPELATVQKSKIKRVIDETSERPKLIPCLEFETEEEIHKYLGFRHITGIKEWGLLEKARYLYSLKESIFEDKTLKQASREIAKMIGSRMDYVRRLLVGFQVFQTIEDSAFYKINGLTDTSFYFNYIVDSLSRAHIRNFINVDFDIEKPVENLSEENLKKWTHWLFEKNDQGKTRLIGNSSDLNDLNLILKEENKDAFIAFDNTGYSLQKAKELTGELDEVFKGFISNAISNLEKAEAMVLKVKDFYMNFDEDLRQIKLISDKIKLAAKAIGDDE